MRKQIKILIMDSGINEKLEFTKKMRYEKICVKTQQNQIYVNDDVEDKNGHGTLIFDLYSKILPNEEYIILKFFDKDFVDEHSLIITLEYILKNISCDIISLSCGINVCSHKHKLKKICEELVDRGTYIVAAFDNVGGITYPAAIECVVGVDYSVHLKSNNNIWVENSPINYIGHCDSFLLTNLQGNKEMQMGNSFIVPIVVEKLVNCLKEDSNVREDVFNTFKSNSTKVLHYDNYRSDNVLMHIKKAVVFPVNKEITTLLKYKNFLNFEIYTVCDIKYSANINKVYYDIAHNGMIVEDIEKLDWDDDFDTFILGHTKYYSYDVRKKILEKCLNYNKNLIVFDKDFINDEYVKKMKSKKMSVYYPEIDTKMIPYQNMGKLYESSTPLVAVFGTGSRQGKFSLQLILRNLLIGRGYKVGQIGTEPSSLLFGMDEVFPIGYNSNNELFGLDLVMILNEMLRRVEEKKYDVILFGSQSYTLPYNFSNINYIVPYQESILQALRPDVVILSIALNDTEEYIKKTIQYIEIVSNAKVIALVISPIRVNFAWRDVLTHVDEIGVDEVKRFMDRIKCLGLPVYNLKENTHMNKLTDKILDYLS